MTQVLSASELQDESNIYKEELTSSISAHVRSILGLMNENTEREC